MSSIYSCDIPPRVWGREARHHGGKKIYLQCFLKNTPKCVSILWFSQLQIHSNFYTSFKLLKFGHEVNIISINSFLSGSYLEHLKRKCISSSTSPELHCWQRLWCRGIPWYLPIIRSIRCCMNGLGQHLLPIVRVSDWFGVVNYISLILNKPLEYIGIENYKAIYKFTYTITGKQKWTQRLAQCKHTFIYDFILHIYSFNRSDLFVTVIMCLNLRTFGLFLK
jgi:hypothetical protein